MNEIKYPSSRRFTFDVGRIGREKHHVKALLEVDVTEARNKIESAKSQNFQDEGDYVLGERRNPLVMKLFANLPQWLRLFLMRKFLLNNPKRIKDMMGTVMVTTAGMAGHTKGWIIPFSMHPLSLSFGSLNEQPALYLREIQIREILHLTVLVDHDVIDGIPAAKFVDDLVRKLEKGFGL